MSVEHDPVPRDNARCRRSACPRVTRWRSASSATGHHTISTTVTRCAVVSYAAVVEYEDVAYASLGQSDEERVKVRPFRA